MMKMMLLWPKLGAVCAILFLTRSESADRKFGSLADIPQAASCSAAEHRQFDFWLGDWDAFDTDNPTTSVARVRVTNLLDGCVVHEDYQDTNGLKGQSFNIYDASRKTWHQSWVTNRGQLLALEGSFKAGEMVLTGVEVAGEKRKLARGTWTPVKGGVREIGVKSADDGKTWQPWFDLMFKPHQP